jgi:hypothetical protein
MRRKPSPKHSLDRIDNDDIYKPGNCRWATRLTQMNNLRSNRRITYQGRTQTMADWARELGINYEALHRRLKTGWTVEQAFTRERYCGRRGWGAFSPARRIEFNGRTHTIAEWARAMGIGFKAFHMRLSKGWTLEEALTIKRCRT